MSLPNQVIGTYRDMPIRSYNEGDYRKFALIGQSGAVYTSKIGLPLAHAKCEAWLQDISGNLDRRADNLQEHVNAMIKEIQKMENNIKENNVWKKENTLSELKTQEAELSKRIADSLKQSSEENPENKEQDMQEEENGKAVSVNNRESNVPLEEEEEQPAYKGMRR